MRATAVLSGVVDQAVRQHLVFDREGAYRVGAGRNLLRRLVTDAVVTQLGGNVFSLGPTPSSPHSRLLATCFATGGLAAASHRSAAALHGLDGFAFGRTVWDMRKGLLELPIEVTVCRPRNRYGPEITHLSRDLTPVDVTTVDGIPCTTVERTIVDLAAVAHPLRVEEALDAAVRDGKTTIERVAARLGALRKRGRTGVRVLSEILERRSTGPAVESVLERRFLRILERYGLPEPDRQVRIRLRSGRTARVDFAYRDARIAIEIDGHGTHSTRRQRQRDSERDAGFRLVEWFPLRLTGDDIHERGSHVARRVRDALAHQARTRGDPIRTTLDAG